MTEAEKRREYAEYRRAWTAAYRRLYGLPVAVRMGRGPKEAF